MSSPTHKNTSRSVIPNQRVVVVSAPVQIAPPRQSAAENADVRVQREGDLVRTIEVVCTCGEHIRLVCDYSAETPPPAEAAASSFERQIGENQNQGATKP